MTNMNPKFKYVILLLIIFTISVIFYNIYLSLERADKTKFQINIVPKNSSITIDGKLYKNGYNYINPGNYHVIISKDGFTTQETTVYINDSNNQINIGLIPESEEAKDWANKNSSQYSELEHIVYSKTISDGKLLVDKYPILENLPYENYLYSIGYRFDNTNPEDKLLIITLHTTEQYRQDAFKQIERWGYTLTDFTYEISNYINPFEI